MSGNCGEIGLFTALLVPVWVAAIVFYSVACFRDFFAKLGSSDFSSVDDTGLKSLLSGTVSAAIVAPYFLDSGMVFLIVITIIPLLPLVILAIVIAFATIGYLVVAGTNLWEGRKDLKKVSFDGISWPSFSIPRWNVSIRLGLVVAIIAGVLRARRMTQGFLGSLRSRFVVSLSRTALQRRQRRSIERGLWGR